MDKAGVEEGLFAAMPPLEAQFLVNIAPRALVEALIEALAQRAVWVEVPPGMLHLWLYREQHVAANF